MFCPNKILFSGITKNFQSRAADDATLFSLLFLPNLDPKNNYKELKTRNQNKEKYNNDNNSHHQNDQDPPQRSAHSKLNDPDPPQ